jgi:hypothetical protein
MRGDPGREQGQANHHQDYCQANERPWISGQATQEKASGGDHVRYTVLGFG